MDNKKIAADVILGKNVILNAFINLYGCEIGDNTKIGTFVEILDEVDIVALPADVLHTDFVVLPGWPALTDRRK